MSSNRARTAYDLTNASAERRAASATATRTAWDFLARNPFIISCALIGIFLVVTLLRPTQFLPAHDETKTLTVGAMTATLRTNTGPRHVEEGDAFEVDLTVAGIRGHVGACPVNAVAATAVAPGTELAVVEELQFSRATCSGSATWLVGTKKAGRIIVAVTLTRHDERSRTPSVGTLSVGADSEPATQFSDALVGGLAALLAALIASLSAGKRVDLTGTRTAAVSFS